MRFVLLVSIITCTINLFFPTYISAKPQDILSINAIYATGNDIYAATTTEDMNDHLFISQNSGVTWKEIPLPNKNNQIAKFITKIFALNNDIYIGTAIPSSEKPHVGGGLWISHNRGVSWEYTSDTVPNFSCNWINDIYATNNGSTTNVYVATMGGGLAVSNDNGKTWLPEKSGWTSDYVRKIHIEGNSIYAATTFDPHPNYSTGDIGGVTFSHNSGESWLSVIPGGNEWVTSVTSIENKIYAVTHGNVNSNDNMQRGGLNIGNYDGSTWITKPVNPDQYGFSYPNLIANIDKNIFVSTENDSGLFVSINDGDTWQKIIDGNINDLCVANKNIYAATYNTILKCSYNSSSESKWNCQPIKQW